MQPDASVSGGIRPPSVVLTAAGQRAKLNEVAKPKPEKKREAASGIWVDIASDPSEHDKQALREALFAYNRAQAGDQHFQELTIWLRDDQQQIVGGVIGSTYWGWLLVEFLWVDERIRGRGYGRLLLTAAEREAVRRGCRHVCLETFSFQAPAFYEKLGYVAFGVLDDFPGRHRRHSLKKDLQPTSSEGGSA